MKDILYGLGAVLLLALMVIWGLALALAVRGEGISDFPICNKSFNLSYCGHDL